MNLFESYERVEPSAIATQLAVLEVVTYHNAVGTGLKQTRDQAVRFTNWVWRKLANSKLINVPPAERLTDQVLRKAEQNARFPKDTLIANIIDELAARFDCPSSNHEQLSVLIIREAAAGLDVDEDLIVGQLAEQVALKYWELLLNQIKEELRKQSAGEAKATEDVISQRLQEMTPAERLELQKTLNLGSLSGEAVRRAFLQSGGPLAAIGLVNMMGFGAFIALSTIIHAIFTTVLGMTLPFAFYTGASGLLALFTGPVGITLAIAAGLIGYGFGNRKLNRAQYAMIVWTCVTHLQHPLYAEDPLLPSMKSSLLLPDNNGSDTDSPLVRAEASDQELSHRCGARDDAQNSHLSASAELSGARKDLERARTRLKNIEVQLITEKLRTAETAASLEQKNSTISRLQADVSRLTSESGALAEKAGAAERKTAELEKRLEAANAKVESHIQGRRKEIERLWAVHFPGFQFSPVALRWVAEKTFKERLEVERALIELRDAEDPVSLSRGKINGTDQHHSGFKLSTRAPARIYFRVSGEKVEITQILKKNEFQRFSATQ